MNKFSQSPFCFAGLLFMLSPGFLLSFASRTTVAQTTSGTKRVDGWRTTFDQQVDDEIEQLASASRVETIVATDKAPSKSSSPSYQPEAVSELPYRSTGHWSTAAKSIFRSQGLPVSLIAVAAAESGFNPFAVSPQGAAGLWQFMPAIARQYGLVVSASRDDRFDEFRSTVAAARYLIQLYDQFGDWPLALTAYNAGADRVGQGLALLDAAVKYIAGFAFGLLILQALFMKDMLGGSYWHAVAATWLPEWLSMNAVMAGMIPVMLILMTKDMRPMEPTSLRFYGVMSFATLVGATLAYPINLWLVKNYLKHGMGTDRVFGNGGIRVGNFQDQGVPAASAVHRTLARQSSRPTPTPKMADMQKGGVSHFRKSLITVLTVVMLACGIALAAQCGNLSMRARSTREVFENTGYRPSGAMRTTRNSNMTALRLRRRDSLLRTLPISLVAGANFETSSQASNSSTETNMQNVLLLKIQRN